jgi:tetratricopeptide (TPR) repeat protein
VFGPGPARPGRTGEAIQILETAFNRDNTKGGVIWAYLGYAYARAGRRADAEKMLASSPPQNQAVIFAGLGDKDRAFEALDRAVAAGPSRLGRELTYPEYALLRGDPRVKALRKKVGWPE